MVSIIKHFVNHARNGGCYDKYLSSMTVNINAKCYHSYYWGRAFDFVVKILFDGIFFFFFF